MAYARHHGVFFLRQAWQAALFMQLLLVVPGKHCGNKLEHPFLNSAAIKQRCYLVEEGGILPAGVLHLAPAAHGMKFIQLLAAIF
jgi:hypothetical protein